MNTIEKLQNIAKRSMRPISLLENAIINANVIRDDEDLYVVLKYYYTSLSTIKDLLEKVPLRYRLDLEIKYPKGYKRLKLILEENQND